MRVGGVAGNDHRHRRDAGRRRAERAARGRASTTSSIQTIPGHARRRRAAQRDARADGGRQRHRAVADDDVLLGQRRRQQRRPHGRERHDRRRGAQRRRVVVRLRRGRRRGSRRPRWRRPRRDGHRRPDHEHRPALGRQHVRGHGVHEPRRRLVARRQPQRRAARHRPHRDARASSRRTTPASRYGGPIVRDRLWFYGQYRNLDTQTAVEGITANANAGNAARWDWMSSPVNARLVQDRQMAIGRFAGQVGRSRIQRQLRVPEALRGHAADASGPRAATTAARIGSASARPRSRRRRRARRRAATSSGRST